MMNAAKRISLAVIAAAFGLGLSAATVSAAGGGEGGAQKARVVAQNGHAATSAVTAEAATNPGRVQLTKVDYGK